ncbi:Unknown protein sequence [Pseudomonas syringae pv. daphniphylli]|uniref:Uncharacterized protein n=1 Tax=Pseudomonas syringae pv. daphniphylli TaxID=264455 RepID=A0A9X0H719_PSESX|nr:Unknown protein sequence [Pseudomonas syringae pv. daphniphylli]
MQFARPHAMAIVLNDYLVVLNIYIHKISVCIPSIRHYFSDDGRGTTI